MLPISFPMGRRSRWGDEPKRLLQVLVLQVRFCQSAGSRLPWKQAMIVSVSSASMTNINA